MHIPKYSFKRFQKGVTLVEVVVAMFIFTLMMTTMIGAFVTLIHRRADVKKMQQQTEESSLVMSYIAKRIRTSDIGPAYPGTGCSPAGLTCIVFDHNINANVTFTFDNGTNELKEDGMVIMSNVTGGFVISAGVAKMVTIRIMAAGNATTSVQTTVSLRSYK